MSSIILKEFLKLEEVDWKIPHNCTAFYDLVDRYHVDTETAEMMLTLDRAIPNLEAREVC